VAELVIEGDEETLGGAALGEAEDVMEEEGEEVSEGEGVSDRVMEGEGLAVRVRELDAVIDALGENEIEADTEFVAVPESEGVIVGVAESVRVPVAESDPGAGETVGVADKLWVLEREGDGVKL